MSGASRLARHHGGTGGVVARLGVGMESADPTEVRLLNRLYVRRKDGSVVAESEWRTRKHIDLFRILALSLGEPISVDRLIDMLWPDTDRERSRASLRTAASQIRGILGYDAVKRRRAGLELDGVWVDSQAFLARATVAHQAHLENRPVDAVSAARQAEALYLRDLEIGQVHSPEMAQWLETEQQRLIKAHTTLMIEAGADALALGWLRDASIFATNAIERNPYCEEAYRIGMLALAGMGEVEQGLALYSRCTDLLSEELGVDPAPQTHAVYLQILRSGAIVTPMVAPLVGRDAERRSMVSRVNAMSSTKGGCLLLTASERGGSTSVLESVAAELGLVVHSSSAQATKWQADSDRECHVYDGVEKWPVGQLRQLLASVSAESRGTTLLGSYRHGVNARADQELETLKAQGLVEVVDLKPLVRSQVEELAQHLLSGPKSPHLIDLLVEETGGRPGAVHDTIQKWVSRGRIVLTSQGLALATGDPGADRQAVYQQLRNAHDQLPGAQQSVLGVVAVVGEGVTAEAVATVLERWDRDEANGSIPDLSHQEVAEALTYLQDVSVLTVDPRGRFSFRSPVLHDVVCDWLRPSAKRAMHRRVVQRLRISPGSRVAHWLAAGEPDLACASAREAAASAIAIHDFAAGRDLLLRACELIDRDSADPRDMIEILSQLAFCAERLGLDEEANRNRATVSHLASTHAVKLPADPTDVLPPVNSISQRARPSSSLLERVGIPLSTAPSPEAEAMLRAAHSSAIRRGDEVEAADASAFIAGLILLPRRRFAEARQLLSVANSAPGSAPHVLSLLTSQEANVLLGDPGVDIALLDRVSQLAPGLLGLVSGLRVEMLCALARHDRCRPDARPALESALELAEASQPDGLWRFVAARMLIERREVERAVALTTSARLEECGPTGHLLVLLGQAAIATAQDQHDAAERHLQRGVERAQLTGATLVLPEVASRLVVLSREVDPSSAIDQLDLAERAQGEVAVGRERVTLALARSAVRANAGRTLNAAEVAGAAADLAVALGMEHLAFEAQVRRQAYLDEAYRRAEMSPDETEPPALMKPAFPKVRRLSAS